MISCEQGQAMSGEARMKATTLAPLETIVL